jgi:transitional endoplasmic reticulum ATPase
MPLGEGIDLGALAAETERFTGADLEDLVRRAGLAALRRVGGEVSTVEAEDFDAALKDSRATVTAEMEEEYKKMRGELKKRAAAVQPIGFFSPEMLKPTREKKHD